MSGSNLIGLRLPFGETPIVFLVFNMKRKTLPALAYFEDHKDVCFAILA